MAAESEPNVNRKVTQSNEQWVKGNLASIRAVELWVWLGWLRLVGSGYLKMELVF